MAFQYVKGAYRRAGRALSGSGVIGSGMDNVFDLKGGRFRSDIRNKIDEALKHAAQTRFQSHTSVLKSRLDATSDNLLQWEMSLPT